MVEIKAENEMIRSVLFFRKYILFPAAVFFCLSAVTAQAASFASWQQEMAKTARQKGISEATITRHLLSTKENMVVVKLDRKQPEGTLRYGDYLQRSAGSKIGGGREQMRKHHKLLREIGQKYQVDPEIIVALWGMETDYGRNTGNINIVDALATLAYEGRRSTLFTDELLTLLTQLDKGEISPKNLRGSWAGAMGQTQFMPSSFAKYAVDYNKDGKKDIWHTQSDVFASIANYLKQEGWQKGALSITPVEVPPHFDRALADLKVSKTMTQWQTLGVKPKHQPASPNTEATLLALDREAFTHTSLVFSNFRVLLKWNYSRLFAGAALHLAHSIKGH